MAGEPGIQGREGIFLNKMYDDGTNKMMTGRLKPGCSIGYHRHEANCEIIFVIEGTGKLFTTERSLKLEPGSATIALMGMKHNLSKPWKNRPRFLRGRFPDSKKQVLN